MGTKTDWKSSLFCRLPDSADRLKILSLAGQLSCVHKALIKMCACYVEANEFIHLTVLFKVWL